MNKGILDEEWITHTHDLKNSDEVKNEIREKISQEIHLLNEKLIEYYKEISYGRVDSYMDKVRHIESKKEGLQLALEFVK